MKSASFVISAFGDEIASDLETQLQVLNELNLSDGQVGAGAVR